jgi:Ni,Fe-hydrogenase I large subunit
VTNTWNAVPHDAEGQPSPYEAPLADTPIAEPHQPLENPAHGALVRSVYGVATSSALG